MIFASSNSLQSCCSKILFPNSHVTFPCCHPFKSSHFRRVPSPAVQSNERPQCEPWLRSSPRNPHCRSVAGLRMEKSTRRFWKILLQWMDEQLMIIELIQRHIQKVDGKKQQIGCHLNFFQGDRREAPIFLILDDECLRFFFPFWKVYRPPAFDDPPTFPEPTVPTVPSQAIFCGIGDDGRSTESK